MAHAEVLQQRQKNCKAVKFVLYHSQKPAATQALPFSEKQTICGQNIISAINIWQI
jgi:hypothetical protein